jgi:alkanesulfonate monooxygenase SsuD/methylene tetrahydromethanopterin reductase-like flavin-dependent oxidoreductase (luciferase family)
MVVGRGSFIDSFPLFGFRLEDYDSLFAEKLDLLLEIRDNEHVTWSGKHRAALTDRGVYPDPCRIHSPSGWALAARRDRSLVPARWGFP